MPNLNVCTGPAFGVGSRGELEPANVRSAVWPFSANPTTASAQMQAANGLRYDQTTITPGGGLWVAEVGPNSTATRQTGTGSTVTVGSTVEATLSALTFSNSSSLQTLSVLVALTWAAAVALPAGTASNVELWGGATTSASAAVTWDAQDSEYAAGMTWRATASESLALTVSPASTGTVTPRLGIKNVAGQSVTWNSWRMVVSVFYALIDPIAEG